MSSHTSLPWWKRLLGRAGLRLEVVLEKTFIPRGAELKGIVHCHGGAYPLLIDKLNLSIPLLGLNNQALYEEALAKDCFLDAHETKTFSFAVLIEDNLGIYGRYTETTPHLFTVVATLNGVLFRKSQVIPVQFGKHREITAVSAAFEILGFQEVPWFAHHLLQPGESEGVSKAYNPPENLADQLREVTILMEIGKEVLSVRLSLALKGEGMGERIKALAGGGRRVETILTIPRSELLTPHGNPSPEGAMPYINDALATALVLPEHEEKWLLRASTAPPPSPNTLLRPAAPVETIATDDLLLPSHPPDSKT